jgi:hypothetical protein
MGGWDLTQASEEEYMGCKIEECTYTAEFGVDGH